MNPIVAAPLSDAEIRASRLQRSAVLVGGGVAGVALGLTGYLEPLSTFVPRCPMHELTGLYCPACGGTRALMRLLHFDFLGALHMNPLAVLASPWLVWLFIMSPARAAPAWKLWQTVTLVAVIVMFTIIRNLPWYPFTLLSPP